MAAALSPAWKPWRFAGTTMQPNTLLLCKLLFVLAAMHDLQSKFRDPYLPFLPWLDTLRDVPGLFPAVLTSVFWLAGAALLLNLWVRTSVVALGTVVIAALVASKPLFQNHAFIVGCLFLLCGLHRAGERPWLIRWQFVVLYFGAALNKILRADWWNGAFMHTWMHDHLGNRLYEFGATMLPERWFAAGVSWTVMAIEIILMVLFLVKRWNHLAVWGVVVVHLGFVAVVGPGPFGYFTEDLLIGMLAFLAWPDSVQTLRTQPKLRQWVSPVLSVANWDGQFRLGEPPTLRGRWFELDDGAERHTNLAGVVRFLKYNPATYVALFCAYSVLVSVF